MQLRGKVVLVTGGAHRLGRAVCLALANRGANIALNYHRSANAAEDTASCIRGYGVRALPLQADAADPSSCEVMFDAIAETFGPIDAWVSCAGVFRRTPLADVRDRDWTDMMHGNVETFRVPAETIATAMQERGQGAIVAISDVAAVRPWPDYIPYCVSKSRLLHLTRYMARQLSPSVRVNTILPGPVLFPDDYPEEARRREVANTLLQRGGHAEDIARAATFLLENDYLTGVALPVDGGRLLA